MKYTIAHHRNRLGMSQRELAEVMKTSQQQIQRMEKGQPITIETAFKFANVFGIEISELLVKNPSKTKKYVNKKLVADALSQAIFECMEDAFFNIKLRVFWDTNEAISGRMVLDGIKLWSKQADIEALNKGDIEDLNSGS